MEIGKDSTEFVDVPITMRCGPCGRLVITQVKQKSNWETYTAFVLLILLTGFLGLCLFPFVRQFTRDVSHRCPNCKSELKRVKRFRMNPLSYKGGYDDANEVITAQCGHCAIVLSKRYFISFVVLANITLALWCTKVYLKSFFLSLPEMELGETIPQTWADFVRDCGHESRLGNPLKTNKMFDDLYYGHGVLNWSGRVNHVRLGVFNKNFIFLNMDPHDQHNERHPDISLIYSTNRFDWLVEDLAQGDLVKFNATLLRLGPRSEPALASLHNMELEKLNAELQPLFRDDKYDWLKRPPIAQVPALADKLKKFNRDHEVPRTKSWYIGDDVVVGQN